MKCLNARCCRRLFLLLVVFVAVGPLASCGDPEPSQDVQNLRAFAKMYGYVRFFHPSDEAASIDWDRFSILGVIRIREASTPEAMTKAMGRLFGPMAPSVQIYPTGERPSPISLPALSPGMETVAWQHVGVRLPGPRSIYQSKRTNRELRIATGPGFGTVIQSVDAAPYLGRSVKLVASVRADVTGDGNQGQMWLRVDRAGGKRGFFDNMFDRPVTHDAWQRVEIVGEVDEDATHLVFGCFLSGEGRVWVDDFELHVSNDDGAWAPIELKNPGFEAGAAGVNPPGWRADTPGYTFSVTGENPHGGLRSVMIEDGPYEVVTDDLFDARPELGEVIETELGAGLSARVPLALPSREGATLPRGDEGRMKAMVTELDSITMYALSEYSECTRLAGVVIAWNVLQHFYPYFDVVDADWDRQLTRALERTLADESGEDYFDTLREMAAALNDGQATIDHPRYRPSGYLPFEIDRVEGKIVVDSAGHSIVERGDVIEVVDGIDAGVALERVESLLSGSPQLKRTRALFLLGAGEAGSSIAMTVRRGEDRLDVEIRLEPPGGTAVVVGPEKIEEITDGIFYVDLSRAAMPEISERMAELATARGVIFDLRGYIHGNQEVIGHLLSEPDTSMDWMRVPQIIYPDHVEPAGWSETGWAMQPLEPRIGGKVAFITNATVISHAESVMGLVEGFELGEIVGQPTAGTNGSVNPMMLPGGFSFPWTGMKVVKLDGSQHHLIGVRPTVSVKRTIQGVREGRDELLEKALEIVDSETTE